MANRIVIALTSACFSVTQCIIFYNKSARFSIKNYGKELTFEYIAYIMKTNG